MAQPRLRTPTPARRAKYVELVRNEVRTRAQSESGARDRFDVPVRADAAGLAFDPLSRLLYVCDDHGRVIAIEEDGAQEVVATLPLGEARLGSPALGADGSLYVPRLSARGTGTILRIAGGTVTPLPELDGFIWRHALASEVGGGALFSTAYLRPANEGQPCHGWVARIELGPRGAVTRVAEGFEKPVGLAQLGYELLVSDAATGTLTAIALASGERRPVVSGLPRPGAVARAGLDAVFVACWDAARSTGYVYKVRLDGACRAVWRGPWQPRGMAVDTAGQRVLLTARGACRVIVLPLE